MRHFQKPLYVSYGITDETENLKQSMTPQADAVYIAFDLASDKTRSIAVIRHALRHWRNLLNTKTVPCEVNGGCKALDLAFSHKYLCARRPCRLTVPSRQQVQ